ncbi:hypothetical protein EMCRGX_G030897 [Ephydatia muelleri]
MERAWTPTLGSAWWTSASTPNLPDTSKLHKKDVSINFYEYADSAQESDEESLSSWMGQDPRRGVIRVYQPDSSYSDVVRCTLDTEGDEVMGRCLVAELYIHYGTGLVRQVHVWDKPLAMQNEFLKSLGFSNMRRIQKEGMRKDLAPLFKFVAGKEYGQNVQDTIQLTCTINIKELDTLSYWSKRFSVLCGARLFVFSTSKSSGKLSYVVDLSGSTIAEYSSKKYLFCLKIMSPRKQIALAFDTRFNMSRWIERASQVVSSHPLEINVSGCSLQKLPKYFFLNAHMTAINLSHNFMFPVSLCRISTLEELDLSCNSIEVVPQEIQYLSKLTTLLLHANKLNSLPISIAELKSLQTLVIAFNHFGELPVVLQDLPSLAIVVASGNVISSVPKDFDIKKLQLLDLRLNKLTAGFSQVNNQISKLNVRGNSITELDVKNLENLQYLNCADNGLSLVALGNHPQMQILVARNNSIVQLEISSLCKQLTSIDLSQNDLANIPDTLCDLTALEKLNVSGNRLNRLPIMIFLMPQLKILKAACNDLETLPTRVGEKCALEQVDIHGNHVCSLPAQLLFRATRLQILNVSSNKLTSLPILSPNDEGRSLVELYASDNQLEPALNIIAGFSKLKVLHLAYNGITNIPGSLFQSLRDLEYVNLSGNQLDTLPDPTICRSLKCLLIHSNRLTALPMFSNTETMRALDASCNLLTEVPKQTLKLVHLDLSANPSLMSNSGGIMYLNNRTSYCFEGIDGLDKPTVPQNVDVTVAAPHGKWTVGSAEFIGITSIELCTAQVKVMSLPGYPEEAMFALMDGGVSSNAVKEIKMKLLATFLEELKNDLAVKVDSSSRMKHYLQYLSHTFLSLHRVLGDVGKKYGSSLVLCHIQAQQNGLYNLNVANTGLGEAVLFRKGKGIPLTTPHQPAMNMDERRKLVGRKGFLSQDDRVNSCCATSRLLGCYHLAPQVIPAPSFSSLELVSADDYIVIGSDSFWKHLTHEQVLDELGKYPVPNEAAKRLRDVAVSYGCRGNVSILIVKLALGNRRQSTNLAAGVVPSSPKIAEVGEEVDEDELEITNIDDLLSDIEEEEEGVASTTAVPKPKKQSRRRPQSGGGRPHSGGPMRGSHGHSSSESSGEDVAVGGRLHTSGQHSEASIAPAYSEGELLASPTPPQARDYPAVTLPRNNKPNAPRNQVYEALKTSFEQTQSVPFLASTPEPIDTHLVQLNSRLSELNEEMNPSRKEANRLSYVKRSYQQFDNEEDN